MSSLHKQSGRPNWFCAFRSGDGRQHFKSTGTANKTEAKIICDKMAEAGRAARKNRLGPEKARRIIEAAVAEIVRESGDVLPHSSIRDFFSSWVKEKGDAGAESTRTRYEGIVAKFLAWLGPRAGASLTSLTKGDVLAFRDELADQVSGSTVNVYLKVLRVALGRAVREQIIERNPAALVENIKRGEKQSRRAFRIDELKKLLEEADSDWSTAIIIAIYTGLRLGDVADLQWQNVDLPRAEMALVTGKTNRPMVLPLARPLLRYLEGLPSADDPKTLLCPTFEGKSTGWLSNQFHELMARAGLVKSRVVHQARPHGKGRGSRRTLSEISFHALRHTATSLLKNAGVSDVIARDIIGHESEAISRNYTHVEMHAKRKAVNAMPDLLALMQQRDLGLGESSDR
ncbi:MAG TPA: tyrosine-type recombinase/integrase [Verrucomicrobiae bacterium]|nr:tyrosine-type recombinase/integrase [Verrucomicrobiae bacterium]